MTELWNPIEPEGAALQNPVARDLWWLVSAPPLLVSVKGFPQHDNAQICRLRKGMDSVVRALDGMSQEAACAAVGVEGWRVGFYFEALVAYWIQHLDGWEMLGTNVQVKRIKETLGAFDFILRNPEGEIEHWEVAVKFYLLLGDRAEWKCWVGPNQRDRLDKKVNRMREHQLVLSKRKEGRAALSALGAGPVKHRFALLKGAFFTEWETPDDGPNQSLSAAQGRWVDVPKLMALRAAFPESRWMKREKPFWLAPARVEAALCTPGHLPKDLRRPEMWSRLSLHADGMWVEADRWFMVPRGWRRGLTRR